MMHNRIIKASFRECSITDRKLFHRSSCLVPISVGQKVHEGEKFLASMKLLNKSFKSCVLLIDDTLQRHTMKINSNQTDTQLYKRSIEEGNLWLERNKLYLQQMNIPITIIRWDDWLKHPNYIDKFKTIDALYNNHISYRDIINLNINKFLNRYKTRMDTLPFNYEKAFLNCLDYLKEECAVMCLWVKTKCEFEVYPSGRNDAMKATYELLIKPYYPDLLKSVALRFKKFISKNPSEQL